MRTRHIFSSRLICLVVTAFTASMTQAQNSLVNWESPHVSPLAISPDGTRLFAVNTPDNRLEIFDLTSGSPRYLASVPVGLDPVSVRPLSNSIVWVANQISDSISVVDLTTMNVTATLATADEPADIAFAGSPSRAFVSCSQANQVVVFDPADLTRPGIPITIQGQRPRALAVSPDGSKVYVAIFESGNKTTAVDAPTVSLPQGPYGGVNPPPNAGTSFSPPLAPGLPPAPTVAMIVQKDPQTNQWLDDNNHNWSGFVTWDLHDHDVAVINTSTLTASGYISGLMNLNMALAVRPDGRISVVGTEATNVKRFEPNLTAKFVRTRLATVDPANPQLPTITDLNPHLATAYAQELSSVPAEQRALSLAEPRAVAFSPDGTRGYIVGLGSNNLIAIDAAGNRVGQVDVGQGPTGLVLDATRGQLYVLNRFDATISVVTTSVLAESTRIPFSYDPTPVSIKNGRPFLYDARLTSGLGVTSCGACHTDGHKDGLAWELGNPAGEMKTFNQTCLGVLPGGECSDWHPMKGPMVTQTLKGIIGTEPLHWRGDREDLAAFNGAFVSLLGSDGLLTSAEMSAFEDFIASVKYPPNPNRDRNDSLTTNVGGNNAIQGEVMFRTSLFDNNVLTCNTCHSLPNGTDQQILPANLPQRSAPQVMKIPQLRATLYKIGFDKTSLESDRGFGFQNDGVFDTVENFLQGDAFTFPRGRIGDQDRQDVTAFLLSLSTDTHAAVGVQVTQNGTNNSDPPVSALISQLLGLAQQNAVGLVVKGRVNGVARGYAYVGDNQFQSDKVGQTVSASTLRTMAVPTNELTWTVVPKGSEIRIGIDRNSNGIYDGDELISCPADLNHDHVIDLSDLALLLSNYGCTGQCAGDVNGDGRTDLADLGSLLSQYGLACP